MERAPASQLGDPRSNPTSAKISYVKKWLSLVPCNTSSMHRCQRTTGSSLLDLGVELQIRNKTNISLGIFHAAPPNGHLKPIALNEKLPYDGKNKAQKLRRQLPQTRRWLMRKGRLDKKPLDDRTKTHATNPGASKM